MAYDGEFFTAIWEIKNLDYCFLKAGEPLFSVVFLVHPFQRTKFRFWMHPRSLPQDESICFGILRDEADVRDNDTRLSYELAFLAEDGSPHVCSTFPNQSFKAGTVGSALYGNRNEVLEGQVNDALTVRCRMWNDTLTHRGMCILKSSIHVERMSVAENVERFSSWRANEKRETMLISAAPLNPTVSLRIFLEGGQIFVEIDPDAYEMIRLCTCKICICGSDSNKTECGQHEFLFSGQRVAEAWKFPLSLTRENILENRELYLENDCLSLCCDLAFSNGVVSRSVEMTGYGNGLWQCTPLPLQQPPGRSSDDLDALFSLKDDLVSLYQEGTLCDVKLRTPTETFPAHRTILSARSPVFRAMFSNDMREKSSECVDIADLDADTVRRMLLFLYTATLEDLQWEDAKNLYFAADKYEIRSLKLKCSSFLKEHLNSTNCCDALVLADTHQDTDLKKFAQNYIAKHDQEVFRSVQWRSVEKDCPLLGLETMRFTYVKGPEN